MLFIYINKCLYILFLQISKIWVDRMTVNIESSGDNLTK